MQNKSIFVFVLFMTVSFWCSMPSESSGRDKYFTVESKTLAVRGHPDLTSKVLTVLQYCDKVLLIKKTKIKVVTDCPDGPCECTFVKIRTTHNIIGYVFKNSLTYHREINYSANSSNYSIEGSWAKYIDDPNDVYYFFNNGRFEEVYSNYEEPLTRLGGKYTYDGCCKIEIIRDDGERINIEVINVNGEVTLKDRCFIFNPEYHSNKMAETRN